MRLAEEEKTPRFLRLKETYNKLKIKYRNRNQCDENTGHYDHSHLLGFKNRMRLKFAEQKESERVSYLSPINTEWENYKSKKNLD